LPDLEGAGSQLSVGTHASCCSGSKEAKRVAEAAAAGSGSRETTWRLSGAAGCKWPRWGITGGPMREVNRGRAADEGAPLGFPKFQSIFYNCEKSTTLKFKIK
jgi:hypothetical protein